MPPHRGGDAVLEGRVEIFVEQVHRLHDVHVAIDKPVAFFHAFLPLVARGATGRLDTGPNACQRDRRVLWCQYWRQSRRRTVALARSRPSGSRASQAEPPVADRIGVAEVARRLRERIASHAIPPGSRLREWDVAADFGVSRLSAREALDALVHLGFVERAAKSRNRRSAARALRDPAPVRIARSQ